jgi:hypothetical protein
MLRKYFIRRESRAPKAQRRRFGNVPIVRHQSFGTSVTVTARFDSKWLR